MLVENINNKRLTETLNGFERKINIRRSWGIGKYKYSYLKNKYLHMKPSLFILLKSIIRLENLSQPFFYGVINKTLSIKNQHATYYNLSFMFLYKNPKLLYIRSSVLQDKFHYNYSPKI